MKEFLYEDYSDTYDYCDRLQRGGLSDFPPAIVSCAITGANQGKSANPNLPETIDEQVKSVVEARQAGAVMVHIHARNPEKTSENSFDPEVFKEINRRVREACPDIIINNTCAGGRAVVDGAPASRLTPSVPAQPEVASIDTTNFCFDMKIPNGKDKNTGKTNYTVRSMGYNLSPSDMELTVGDFKANGIKPEFELFDVGDMFYVRDLLRKGILPAGPVALQFVFTAWANLPTMEYMLNVCRSIPKGCIMTIAAIGPVQFPILAQALTLGLHVRVGMEDNVYIKRGQLAESNAELVAKIIRIAHELDRPVATVEQAREMLGLGAPRQYR